MHVISLILQTLLAIIFTAGKLNLCKNGLRGLSLASLALVNIYKVWASWAQLHVRSIPFPRDHSLPRPMCSSLSLFSSISLSFTLLSIPLSIPFLYSLLCTILSLCQICCNFTANTTSTVVQVVLTTVYSTNKHWLLLGLVSHPSARGLYLETHRYLTTTGSTRPQGKTVTHRAEALQPLQPSTYTEGKGTVLYA